MELDGSDGRTAFVTGGRRGIGWLISERLRDLGGSVAVGDLEPPDIPGVHGLALDVTDEQSVASTVAKIGRELPRDHTHRDRAPRDPGRDPE